jgi:small subunit ribosomal protein S9
MRRKSPRCWPSSRPARKSQEDIIATQDTYRATGRRKTAIARVILKPGTGKRTINDRTFTEFFANAIREMIVEQPLTILNVNKQWDVIVTSNGGGVNGTAGAVRLGIARALVAYKPEFRAAMREHGLMTRDSRAVERKKYGKSGARRSFQFSKR